MRKRDAVCEPLRPDTVQDQQNVQFLHDATETFTILKLSGKAGLTNETFMACIQSMQVMIDLLHHLTNQHFYLYILSGKFSSDPIERRFGWYRQTNGGNFYTSINQLYQAEKKIRCISLLKQDALHQIANLAFGDIPSHPVSDNSSEGIRLHEFLSDSTIDDMTDSDTSVTY